jgi:demethylmenaquinone methyltransferase/2-methoxy-6-polyprenyl-1,4-benzoquinol methylase
MALDLAHGKRAYDLLGRHPRLYRAVRFSVCFGRERRLQQLAVAATGLAPGATVLDLACGTGVNHPHLHALVGRTGRILAVDYSTGMLETARAAVRIHGWTNIDFLQADAACLDLPAASLDAALCTFGLSAMPGERAALQRVATALKPGAPFVALDAKAFTGWASVFNPIAGPVFQYTTNWDYRKDVVASIRATFPHVQLVEFNAGCNFLAVAHR